MQPNALFNLKMKQKQLRELFSIGLSVLWYEMKTEKVENRRWRKESFS